MAQTNPMPMGPWKVRQQTAENSPQAERGCLGGFDHICSNSWTDVTCFIDHRVRPGALPGQAHRVHRQLPEHHGVWGGEHPFSEDRVWSVRNQNLLDFFLLQ